MSFEEPVEVKNWKRERVLGSGGFGTVTLWRQKNGDETIALKKCRCGADTLLNTKQKERWRKEVEIMQRLNHPNVVRALPLPEDLAKLPSVLPILCMEYCSKGDLRQLLNRPENSCGLQENDVRKLIQNVSSAVSYLHSEKITHRDLKPENIVLAQNDSGTIYKLIDLGYAKELDQSSCTSFVGTLQYLAPELFTNEKYSSSVDYWSLGLVSHEVITGIRPFLPNMAPVAWMRYVKQKSKDHICAYQTEKGKIEFSSHLFPQNHISSVLKKDMEDWLKLVLEWDPKKRGKNSNGEVIVFNEIESVLAKKVVRVFCMVTYVKLSYAVEDSTPLSLLREWIENDTKVPAREQELVLANGQQIDSNGLLGQCFNGTSQESLFVFRQGELVIPVVPPNFPHLVANILQSPHEKLEYVFQRRAYSHAVFFLQQESKLYKTFLMGCKLKLLSVVLQCQKVVRESQKITDQSNAITALRELCVDAYKFDATQAQRAKLSTKTDVVYWQRQMDVLNNKYSDLLSKTQVLTVETQKVTKLARKLQSAQPSNMKEDPVLNSSLETGLGLLDRLRKRPASERSSLIDSKEMARVVYHFLKQRDVLLHDQEQTTHLKQLIDCENDLVKLLPKLEDLSHRLSVLKLEIMNTNRERQRSVWDLLKSSLADGAYSPGGSPSTPNYPLSSHDRSHPPYRSHSSRNLYSEDHPPPVPPHGLSHFMTASSLSLFNPCSPAVSQTSLNQSSQLAAVSQTSLNQSSQPAFDLTSLQQQLGQINLSNGIDSGIASGYAKGSAKGSTLSLAKYSGSGDADLTMSMINENKSLRMQTQELLEDCSRFRKAVNEDDTSLDWSFLKTDTS
ncbi:inhibitor of nuclear factor kappa-B kinase subunit alpha [Thrips palmi]|uniref:IkappaB kinase n=1 Tax=Thrips palmi TaxID=161013 RepID=A0A6P8YMS9_THRPL|nr:inhibitor of nuclear factor kappa-B kinase subunit alpha [Thrips palmi]XP_034238473.1 inhibitor of nuclear factor kappa-B kinase subunit alpha [Thrips palmi]XP_034238474.1 inhibitor of nuclear factor kappa-B kinase subunit alpha [Thrips palmi]XP_034238475.1 inhibitor of nuclear factor kappa-B kinase subunit alpha [Thrips palmi]XP_034238476.1 inhibitor of nuclear factor kappa-B kinase subunit alpha [Thrips palmi]XP_034238477.1 inhibitor of nuclear factor kappa-B kinase subunit alpha [Thrips 